MLERLLQARRCEQRRENAWPYLMAMFIPFRLHWPRSCWQTTESICVRCLCIPTYHLLKFQFLIAVQCARAYVLFLSHAGSCWDPVLRWSLCLHYLWWLWSLLWGCVHLHPSSNHHWGWSSALRHRSHWMLCYSERKLLWIDNGQSSLL